MRLSFLCLLSLLLPKSLWAQVPIPMSAQPNLSYQESFSNIGSWTNGFTSGIGATCWSGNTAMGAAAIPNATKITHSTTSFAASGSGGVHRDSVNGRIMLLATGTTDNSSAAAIDLLLNYSNTSAGTLSFDWAEANNGVNTSNRKGSLRVYAAIDTTNFTELTGAQVLNITNFAPTNGSVTNVALPASFTNNTNARLRFYYYNGTGGTSGSRPYIAIDNIKVTALGSSCTTPTASPANLVFSNVTATTMQISFTAASPACDEYMVVATTNASLTSMPADSFLFSIGDNVGDGIVMYRGSSTSCTLTGLSPQTTYSIYVFPVNSYCSYGVKYKVSNVLNGVQTTPAGPPCATPTSSPTNLQWAALTSHSINGSFTSSGASEYLVLRTSTPSFNGQLVNGTTYNDGDIIGNATVVYRGGATSFAAIGLNSSTTYYFYVFALENYACSNGPVYKTTAPLTGNQTTAIVSAPCTVPAGDASNLTLNAQPNSLHGFFTPFNTADAYLVVMSTTSTLSVLPQNGVAYNSGATLGGGIILSTGVNYAFSALSLSANTTYYLHVFAYKYDCLGGPIYKTTGYLKDSTTLPVNIPYHFYFGNLHAHSSYSDGNKDNGNLTPTDDYAFAQNAQCMDFLGISEHNHYSSNNNPGMLLPKYQLGLNQAANYTSSHPGFLALYGMEWGTLSNGGHVLVYGIDQLIGWETVNGSPNYDIYVAQNDYLSSVGLLRKVNDNWNNNAFATLAHPSSGDFSNIANIAYNPSADSALSGVAVESGPAFSTNTQYADPSNMSYLSYFQKMLAKGYHLAPMIDHDNHNTTFGKTAYTRTAVIAPLLDKSNFMNSMKNRRFYATEDCDTRAEILIYNQPMGSIFSHAYAPAITITAIDPTNPTATPTIKLMYGVPGSGVLPVQLVAVNTYTFNYTDVALPLNTTGYYYADVTIAGNRTVTAPIWYTRNDSLATVINTCASAPNSPVINSIVSYTCPNTAFTIAASGYTSGNGISYQWETAAPTSNSWTPIVGETNTVYTNAGGIAATQKFRLKTSCSAANLYSYSNVFTMGIVLGITDTVNSCSSNLPYVWQGNSYYNTGVYTINYTSVLGCDSIVRLVFNSLPLPLVDAGSSQSVCAGSNALLAATGAATYSWSQGVLNNQPFYPDSTRFYYVIGTGNNGCSNADSVLITVLPKPTANAGGNKAICTGGNTLLTASGGSAYLWSNGSNTATVSVTQPGSYYVVATGLNGCTDTSDPIQVVVKSLPATVKIKIVGAISVCQPNSIPLTLDMTPGSISGFDCQWYTIGAPISGATDSVYYAASSGSYLLKVSGGSNCAKFSNTKAVSIKPNPTAQFSASGSTTFCTGGFVTLIAPTITGYAYSWLRDSLSAGSGNQKTFKLAGNYTVVAKLNGCNDTAERLALVVNPLPVATITATTPTTCCIGDSCSLLAYPSATGFSYEWKNGTNSLFSNTPVFSVYGTGTYRVMITDTNNCTSKLSATSVKTKFNPIPAVTIVPVGSTSLAIGGSVKLNAVPSSGVTWQWYKDGNSISGATAKQYIATTAGTYTVAVNKLGCIGLSTTTLVTQSGNKDWEQTSSVDDFYIRTLPNPVVHQLLLEFVGAAHPVNAQLEIIDLSGKRLAVYNCNATYEQKLDFTSYSSGTYYIRYQDTEGRMRLLKVVKQ